MWKVSVDTAKTTPEQKITLEGIYGISHFPRKIRYKKDAIAKKNAAEFCSGATMKVEKTS